MPYEEAKKICLKEIESGNMCRECSTNEKAIGYCSKHSTSGKTYICSNSHWGIISVEKDMKKEFILVNKII